MAIRLTTYDIYDLCNKNKWFTCGDNEQYEKMFDFVRENDITYKSGLHLTSLSYIIWICSSNASANEIYRTIRKYLIDKKTSKQGF